MTWINEFHIHIDASWIESDFEAELLADRHYFPMDFARGPRPSPQAPERHITAKFQDSISFKRASDLLFKKVNSSEQKMRGYIETECVGHDIVIPESPAVIPRQRPFMLELKALKTGEFRESELHFTFSFERSDPKAVAALESTGLYPAYLKKQYGLAQVLTAQGRRDEISRLMAVLSKYLVETGGFCNGVLKEERIAQYWLSEPSVSRPPVIGRFRIDHEARG